MACMKCQISGHFLMIHWRWQPEVGAAVWIRLQKESRAVVSKWEVWKKDEAYFRSQVGGEGQKDWRKIVLGLESQTRQSALRASRRLVRWQLETSQKAKESIQSSKKMKQRGEYYMASGSMRNCCRGKAEPPSATRAPSPLHQGCTEGPQSGSCWLLCHHLSPQLHASPTIPPVCLCFLLPSWPRTCLSPCPSLPLWLLISESWVKPTPASLLPPPLPDSAHAPPLWLMLLLCATPAGKGPLLGATLYYYQPTSASLLYHKLFKGRDLVLLILNPRTWPRTWHRADTINSLAWTIQISYSFFPSMNWLKVKMLWRKM